MLAPAVAAVRYIAVAGFLSIYVSFIASSSTLFWFELKAVFEPSPSIILVEITALFGLADPFSATQPVHFIIRSQNG